MNYTISQNKDYKIRIVIEICVYFPKLYLIKTFMQTNNLFI